MQRVTTTVVALVGPEARQCLKALEEDRPANVRTSQPEPAGSPLERAVAAWRAAQGTHTPYLVHDADPLAAVVDAWVRRFDEQGPIGELEVAVAETLKRWRARSLELPDYYLVLDAGSWEPTRRHWYLGVLHRAAPARVALVPAGAAGIRERLGQLAPGPWWPPLDRLLDGVDRVVPDRA